MRAALLLLAASLAAEPPRVAVLLTGEFRGGDHGNLAGAVAAFDVFVATYSEYAAAAHALADPARVDAVLYQ